MKHSECPDEKLQNQVCLTHLLILLQNAYPVSLPEAFGSAFETSLQNDGIGLLYVDPSNCATRKCYIYRKA